MAFQHVIPGGPSVQDDLAQVVPGGPSINEVVSTQTLSPGLYVDDDTFYSATVAGGEIATPVKESAGGGRFYYLPPEAKKKKKRAVEKEVESVRDVELVSKAEQFPREIADQIEQALAKMREISRIDAEIMILMERDLFEEEALLLLMAA